MYIYNILYVNSLTYNIHVREFGICSYDLRHIHKVRTLYETLPTPNYAIRILNFKLQASVI